MKKIWLVAAIAVLALVAGATNVLAGDGDDGDDVAVEIERMLESNPARDDVADAATTKNELLFVPLDGCTVYDNRSPDRILRAAQPQGFDILGPTKNYSGQGGKAGGCGVVDDAVAVSLTVTSVRVPDTSVKDGRGSVRIWSTEAGRPISKPAAVTFVGGVLQSNEARYTVCRTNCSSLGELFIQATGNDVYVQVDVNGYYVAPLAASVNADGTLQRSSRVAGITRQGTGVYDIVFNRPVDTCYYQVTRTGSFGTFLAQPLNNTSAVRVLTINFAGNAFQDASFHLDVHC